MLSRLPLVSPRRRRCWRSRRRRAGVRRARPRGRRPGRRPAALRRRRLVAAPRSTRRPRSAPSTCARTSPGPAPRRAPRPPRPAAPVYDFTPYDRLVDEAAARGLRVQLTLTGPAPAWASGATRSASTGRTPSASACSSAGRRALPRPRARVTASGTSRTGTAGSRPRRSAAAALHARRPPAATARSTSPPTRRSRPPTRPAQVWIGETPNHARAAPAPRCRPRR